MHPALDFLRDLIGPGLVFLALCFWLVRKALKAARTESELEGERLKGAFAEELQRGRELARARQKPRLQAVPTPPSGVARPALPSGVAAVAPPEPASPWFRPPEPTAPPLPGALAGADAADVPPGLLALVAALAEERELALLALTPLAARRRLEVLWVRAAADHVVWCERRHPAVAEATLVRDVICVVKVQDGKAAERWTFG